MYDGSQEMAASLPQTDFINNGEEELVVIRRVS